MRHKVFQKQIFVNQFKLVLIIVAFGLMLLRFVPVSKNYNDWRVAGGSKENIHYSSLKQVDTSNVASLKIAWVYRTGDADTLHHSQIQCNPIIIDDVLYATSPLLKLFALDNSSGKPLWVFDPFKIASKEDRPFVISLNNNRGVTYWKKGKDSRIFYTVGSFLFAVDALSGELVNSFGKEGKIDLRDGLGRSVSDTYVVSTSPGIIFKDILIIGTRVSESYGSAPGHIRAYDVRSGEQKWIFHTIPQPGQFGFETWEDSTAYRSVGGANAWAGFGLDEKRGIVFAPTGSAAFDFYGGKRKGANLFANCILALDAATGRYIWHYQTIHHDVWDRDLPAAPSLVTVNHNNKTIDAIAQVTKTGFIFLLNRENGIPLFPIEEKSVSLPSGLIGEKLWATQPIPLLPKPFTRQSFQVSDLNTLLPDSSYQNVKNRFLSYKSGYLFTPPSQEGTIFFPGLEGGANWGGAAFDPGSSILFINANEVPWIITIKDSNGPAKTETYLSAGKRLYSQHCASCHGSDKNGAGNSPALTLIETRYTSQSLTDLIVNGRRMMPSFQYLTSDENEALATYLLNLTSNQDRIFVDPPKKTDAEFFPYSHEQKKFLSSEGYPAILPPWGTLNAVNLSSGKIEWRIPLGEYPEFKIKGIITGTENYGGPVVTAGGLIFIGATKDGKFRAFNKRSGKLLWETDLPAPGFATPSTYEVKGKQYIVIACGGGKLGTRSGDTYVAFALPHK
jgi:quinoprotein glucose dehydrogenase